MDPEDTAVLHTLAQVYRLMGRPEKSRPLLEEARALDPENPDLLEALGWWHLNRGEHDAARTLARQALEMQPEHQDALVLMGHICLREGNRKEAREHALWALRQNPGDPDSLRLLAACKARENWFLGAWWRFVTWMSTLGHNRSILILLGAYLVYRVAAQAAGDLGQPTLSLGITVVWLALCVYTWVGPGLFRRLIRKELAAVRLDQSF